MALLERVATLLRANFNDLIDRAEDPEKMMKQLVLDMENQLLQVKTQVAIAIADGHLLQKNRDDHEKLAQQWQNKAALAMGRDREDMARAALQRALSESEAVAAFTEQLADQAAQTDTLRNTYAKLQAKLADTDARCATLLAAGKRARTIGRAQKASGELSTGALNRYAARVDAQTATNAAHAELNAPGVEASFAEMERQDQVEALLLQLKQQRALTA